MMRHGYAWWGMAARVGAWTGIGWHDVSAGMPVRGRVWRVVAGYGGESTFTAMPRHWLPRLDMRGDGKLRRLLAIARGDYIHLPFVAIYWHTPTCGNMHYHGRQR
jgi:hypothetical protein